MTTMLPSGVIRTSDRIGGEIQSIDRVAIEDIARLWRVYRTNRRALQGDTGGRLENLFWRIWSNGQVHAGITGSAVARIFLQISETRSSLGVPLTCNLRPDTISETRPETAVPAYLQRPPPSPSASSASSRPPAIHVSNHAETAFSESLEKISSPSPSPKPLPPILKSGRKLSGSEHAKTARIASPVAVAQDSDDDLSSRAPSPHPRSPLESSFEEQPHHMQHSTTHHSEHHHQLHPHHVHHHPHVVHKTPGRKKKGKTVFVAGAGASRRRPAMTRRKSSQSSASTLKSHVSDSGDLVAGPSRHRSRPSASSGTSMARYSPSPPPLALQGDSANALAEMSLANDSPLRTPSPTDITSRPVHRPEHDRASSAEQHSSMRPYDDWVANREFEARFVDPKPQDMFMVLSRHPTQTKAAPVVAPTSMAAAGLINQEDSIPAAISHPSFMDRILPLKQPVTTVTSDSALDENYAPLSSSGTLPRTKSQSQLSFLLERDRRHSEEAAKAQQHLFRKTST